LHDVTQEWQYRTCRSTACGTQRQNAIRVGEPVAGGVEQSPSVVKIAHGENGSNGMTVCERTRHAPMPVAAPGF
jgi:hypothetical protein